MISRTTLLLISACPILLLFSCQQHSDQSKVPQMDGMELAMQQEFRMTRDPHLNYIPRERLNIAENYMRTIAVNGGMMNRLSALSWQERGPSNVGGRTRSIMIDTRDPSGNTVFAGSVSGGIFKTTNFTNTPPTWVPVNDFLINLAITAIVQDRVQPATMYATTGEGWFNIDAVKGNGIYKSTDGGSNWNLLASTTGFEYIQDFVIDNNGNLYASLRNLISTHRGVMRSTDGGSTWTQVLGTPLPGFATGRATDLEVAANGDIYAALGLFTPSVVMKSSFATHGANTGAVGTWTNITPITPTPTQRTEILVAPSDAQRVYLLMQDSATSQVLNIFRSTNAGNSWTTLNAPSALNNGNNSQTWYNLIGAVSPDNPNVLVVGGLNIGRSTDGGDNWTTITSGGTVHVDHHVLLYDGPTRLLNGNDGGVYHSLNINAPSPGFINKNNGFNVTQYYACEIHPTTTNYFLAGAQDNGTQKFTAGGINITTNATGGDGGFCHIDKTDGQIQITSLVGSDYGISTNGGASFTRRDFNPFPDILGQFINPSDYDDAQNILYAGGNPGAYTFINNLVPASSATLNTRNISSMGSRELTAVLVDPFAPNTIWVGASFASTVPQVLKISNANSGSPTVVSVASLGSVNNSAVSSIDVDPSNPNHIIATLSNYGVISVWESTNGGASFASMEGNLPDMPVRWVMFAPASAELNGPGGGLGGVMLGTELGVWTASQLTGGSTAWIPNNTGLANVRTDMLRYRSSDNTVAAATHGRGLFTTLLPTVVTGINDPTNTKDFIKYIHSGSNQLLIVPGTLQTRSMTIQVFDMQGRKLYQSSTPYRTTTINTTSFPKGVYTLRCTGDRKEEYVSKFLK